MGCAVGVCPDGVSYLGGQWNGKFYVCMYWLPGEGRDVGEVVVVGGS